MIPATPIVVRQLLDLLVAARPELTHVVYTPTQNLYSAGWTIRTEAGERMIQGHRIRLSMSAGSQARWVQAHLVEFDQV